MKRTGLKKADIFVDFTSLLDVTLIIIFFFIMFSTMDTGTKTKQAMAQAETMTEQAEEKLAQAEELQKQAEEEMKALEDADARRAQDVSAMIEFARGQNYKFIMKEEGGSWTMHIKKGDEEIDEFRVDNENALAEDIKSMLKENGGVDNDMTVLCELHFDGAAAGSRKAYRITSLALEKVRRDYPHFYCSETDYSLELNGSDPSGS